MDNYKIIDMESLNLLLKKKHQHYGRFIIEIENLDENKARKFENDLNKFHSSCGCTTGNYFLMVTLITCAAYIFITGEAINNWKIILQGFSILLIAAVLGKFTGKLMDGFKYKKTLQELSYEIL